MPFRHDDAGLMQPYTDIDPLEDQGYHVRDENRPNALLGIAAGIAAGLIASAVMNGFQSLVTNVLESRKPDAPNKEQGAQKQKAQKEAGRDGKKPQDVPATVRTAQVLSEVLLGRKLRKKEEEPAGQIMHYLMGATSGAIYGAAVEYNQELRLAKGALFGAAVWAIADEVVLPLTGLSKSPDEFPPSIHVKALLSHFVYGISTELIRAAIRRD